MIAASSAAWLGDLRRAIGGPNSVAAVYPALIGLETDSDAAMGISLKAFSLLAAGVTRRPCQERYSLVHCVVSCEKNKGTTVLLCRVSQAAILRS
jgi:hypothetical protein